jgi:CO/xanthine dehydrogenase Mo-binding subunit
VDTETGQIRLLNYVATQDSGTVLNPKVLENQIIGAAIAGSGFALAEGLVFDEKTGKILNPNFLDYKVLRAPDFPTQPTVVFCESYDPVGPYGAKGAGEAPIAAPLPAIAQAVYNAIGVWLDVPMTPERVLRGIGVI